MFGISELAAWVCRYLPLRFFDSLCSSPFFSFRCGERRTSSETGRPLPAGKAGVRKRSSSASAVRREVPVSGNGLPACREQDSQPLGTGFPTGWEHLSQECGHRDRCVFNVFACLLFILFLHWVDGLMVWSDGLFRPLSGLLFNPAGRFRVVRPSPARSAGGLMEAVLCGQAACLQNVKRCTGYAVFMLS